MTNYNIPGVTTFEFTKIVGLDKITFGNHIIIDDFVFIYATNTIILGSHIHIASFTSITGGGELIIDDLVAISSGVRLVTGTDDFKDGGFGTPTVDRKYRRVKTGTMRIGKFCIVGANAVILPGVTIGEGATVGASSVVTRDLEPWGVYIGNKRIAERNRTAVLDNYARYIQESGQV